MRNILLKKGLVIGIIILFMGIVIFPSISGNIQENFIGENGIIDMSTQRSFNVTVETDKYYYFRGETVQFSGQLKKDGVGFKGEVQFELIDPLNRVTFGGEMYTDNSGLYYITYYLRYTEPIGLFTFKIEYKEDPSASAKTTFEVKPSIQIENIRGGFGKIQAQITNIRGEKLYDVNWSLGVEATNGTFLFEYKIAEGTIPIFRANDTISIKTSGFMLGFGDLIFFVNAEFGKDENIIIGEGYLFLIFIKLN